MKDFLAAALLMAGVVFVHDPGWAGEFYMGEPVVEQGLQLSPAYLTGIEMDRHPPGMSTSPDAIHIEIDIHATDKETHGFPPDAWIAYLNVELTVQKTGGTYSETKVLAPMQAADGPHYANNFAMDGPGDYKATYKISPPDLIRHIDKETGVPAWWQPITAEWDFKYPSKPNP